MSGDRAQSPALRTRSARPGFATVTAVTLLALVAVALTAVAARMTADYLRTRDAEADAQLRQLLLAGAADASNRAAPWGDRPAVPAWALELPPALAARGGSVRAAPAAPDSRPADAGPAGGTAPADESFVSVHLTAEYAGRRAGQSLRFQRQAGRWSLTEATMDGAAARVRP